VFPLPTTCFLIEAQYTSLVRQSIGCVAADVMSKGLGAILSTGDRRFAQCKQRRSQIVSAPVLRPCWAMCGHQQRPVESRPALRQRGRCCRWKPLTAVSKQRASPARPLLPLEAADARADGPSLCWCFVLACLGAGLVCCRQGSARLAGGTVSAAGPVTRPPYRRSPRPTATNHMSRKISGVAGASELALSRLPQSRLTPSCLVDCARGVVPWLVSEPPPGVPASLTA
jgi:hypothetical protein